MMSSKIVNRRLFFLNNISHCAHKCLVSPNSMYTQIWKILPLVILCQEEYYRKLQSFWVTTGSICQTRKKRSTLLHTHKKFSLLLLCVVRRGRRGSIVTATAVKGASLMVTNLIHGGDRAKRIPTKEARS